MKLLTLSQYFEKFDSTLENEIHKALRTIKNKVEGLFFGDDIKTYSEYGKASDGILKDTKINILDSKLYLNDPMTDYYKLRFNDADYEYAFTFLISLDENFKKYSNSKDEPERVLKTDLTFKKYDLSSEVPILVSEINKTIPIKDINEDLFIQLNIEADDYDNKIDDLEIDDNHVQSDVQDDITAISDAEELQEEEI